MIIYMEGRGAVVSDPRAFLKVFSKKGKGKRLALVPLNMAYGIEVYSFECTFKGLGSDQWAWMWLKGQHSARQAGSYVPTPTAKKDCTYSSRAVTKEFSHEVRVKNSLRKKGDKSLPPGSWWSDGETPLKGLGGYRP